MVANIKSKKDKGIRRKPRMPMRHTHLVELLNKLRIESGADSSSNLKILKEKNIPNKSTLNKTKMENVKTGNNAKTVWAKGTGYGANNISDVTNFDPFKYNTERKREAVETISILEKILNYLEGVAAQSDLVELPPNKRRRLSETIQVIAQKSDSMGECISILKSSCLLPFLEKYLENDSILDMERHANLYLKQMEMLYFFGNHSEFHELLLCTCHSDAIPASTHPNPTMTIQKACSKLYDLLSAYWKKTSQTNAIKTAAKEALETTCKNSNLIKTRKSKRLVSYKMDNSVSKAKGGSEDDSMIVYALNVLPTIISIEGVIKEPASMSHATSTEECIPMARSTRRSISSATRKHTTPNQEQDIPSGLDKVPKMVYETPKHIQSTYVSTMKELLYTEVESFQSFYYGANSSHANMDDSTMGNNVRSRLKRMAQEHVDLSRSNTLPCSYSSTIWVCTSSTTMECLKAMISGPADTPYENGLFVFDIKLPPTYPMAPPWVRLQTTGYGTVRFNPNLYNCGKVCLSLLGTWSGEVGETWNEHTSTILQVLVSIQSLILVPDPYFNEPGYESTFNSPSGMQRSRDYNISRRISTIQYGMNDYLMYVLKDKIESNDKATSSNSNPISNSTNNSTSSSAHYASEFKTIVRQHFLLKRDEIIAQVERWLAELDANTINGNNPTNSVIGATPNTNASYDQTSVIVHRSNNCYFRQIMSVQIQKLKELLFML